MLEVIHLPLLQNSRRPAACCSGVEISKRLHHLEPLVPLPVTLILLLEGGSSSISLKLLAPWQIHMNPDGKEASECRCLHKHGFRGKDERCFHADIPALLIPLLVFFFSF